MYDLNINESLNQKPSPKPTNSATAGIDKYQANTQNEVYSNQTSDYRIPESGPRAQPIGYSPMDMNEARSGLNFQPLNQPNSGQYNLSNDQYQSLGQGLWDTANNPDFYGQGWLNLGDYGGSNQYEFAYDDTTDIGVADPNDLSRWLYVRQANDPNNVQRYNLFNANDPNVNLADVGQRVLAGGDNYLTNFWNQFYDWGLSPQQMPITGGQVEIPAVGNGVPTTVEDARDYGLGAAQGILDKMLNQPNYYPSWWGENYQALDPNQWMNKYPEFLDVPGYSGIDIPGEYQGLMEGDYNRLEDALRQPGEIAAKNAFEQGGDYLKNVMGGQGLYGSSVMGNQANTGLNDRYMDTMAQNAANAVAQRYGMQQGDLQFGANYGLQRGDLMRQNALDQYKAAMTSRNLFNDYNNQRFQFDYGLGEAARGEYNNLLQNRSQYDLAAQEWRNALNERLMNSSLALSGFGAPLANANRAYDQQQQQYNDSQWGNYAGLAYQVLDRTGALGSIGDGISSLWDSWGW